MLSLVQAKIPIPKELVEPIRKMRKEAAKCIPKKKGNFLDEDSGNNDEEEEIDESTQSEQEIINAELSMVR